MFFVTPLDLWKLEGDVGVPDKLRGVLTSWSVSFNGGLEVTIEGRRIWICAVEEGTGVVGVVASGARLPESTFAEGINGRRWRATAV